MSCLPASRRSHQYSGGETPGKRPHLNDLRLVVSPSHGTSLLLSEMSVGGGY
jgi:hypothetical protein